MTEINPDQVTRTTHTSAGRRIFKSFVLVPVGFLAVIAAIFTIYWNEGRAVQAATALREGESAVVEAPTAPIDPGLDGKLVHVTGPLGVERTMQDDRFPVGGPDVVRLSRIVEMYQWKETSEQKSRGGGDYDTVYTYSKDWSDKPIDSAAFDTQEGHRNPAMALQGEVWDNLSAKLGAYRVDQTVLDGMNNFAPYGAGTATAPTGFRREGAGFYQGANSGSPALGDLRVHFEAVTAQPMSVVAAQHSGALTAYQAGNGYRIALSAPGTAIAIQMLKDKESDERGTTWLLRGVGFVVMAIGFMLILGPISALASVLPFLGGLVRAGAFMVGIGLAVPLTLIVIGLSWVAHRPLLGVGLLALAAVVFGALIYRHRHGKAAVMEKA
ncbi:MAG TPA: TMEM43 family protein [Stellaceae bacterium]